MSKKRADYPYWSYPSRRAYLRAKRAEAQRLLNALNDFRIGCYYLPPADGRDGGALISQIEKWVKGPCRAAWRKA